MKKKVGIIFGGKSTEHEISVLSAKNVYKNLDKELFEPYLIYISKTGCWFHVNEEVFVNDSDMHNHNKKLALILEENSFLFTEYLTIEPPVSIDVIFPILHGPNGEDGTMQGLFEVAGLPFVGPGVAGSSISMDKDIAKRLLQQAGLDVAKYVCLNKNDNWKGQLNQIIEYLGLPMVIKPSRAGSSVGLSKVTNLTELINGIELAFKYDTRILIEEYLKGREIEVAVLGNEEPIASIPGEIVTEFYDYKEKYSQDSKTKLDAPAKLDFETEKLVKSSALKAFKALDCEGMSRVDFFLLPNRLVVNEINTIPGFTNISMYPKLFELSGVPQMQLITQLIELAFDRLKNKNQLNTFYEEI